MNRMKISIINTNYESDGKSFVKCTITCKVVNPIARKSKESPKFKCIGIATLHKNDKFDYNIGSKIALAKAERIAYRCIYKHTNKELDYLYKLVKIYDDFCFKAKAIVEHNTNYIKELVK